MKNVLFALVFSFATVFDPVVAQVSGSPKGAATESKHRYLYKNPSLGVKGFSDMAIALENLSRESERDQTKRVQLLNELVKANKARQAAEASKVELQNQLATERERFARGDALSKQKIAELEDILKASDKAFLEQAAKIVELTDRAVGAENKLQEALDAFVSGSFATGVVVKFKVKGLWVDSEENTVKASEIKGIRLNLKFIIPSESAIFSEACYLSVILHNRARELNSDPKLDAISLEPSGTPGLYLFKGYIEFEENEPILERLRGKNLFTVRVLGGRRPLEQKIPFKLE